MRIGLSGLLALGVVISGALFSGTVARAGEQVYFFHNDHLGTPQAMTDSDGRIVWTAEYDPFGKATVNEDPDGDGKVVVNNLRFPGQYFDAETGLHYNWMRYYDPGLGRYLQPDPIGQEGGPNIYAYAGGNPIKNVDPEGLDYWIEGAVKGEGGLGFHQSLCVGNPTGPQYCITFGIPEGERTTFGCLLFDGCKGRVGPDRSKPGPLIRDKYRYTSPEVDAKIKHMLESMIGTPGDYFLLENSCRHFVDGMFSLLVKKYGGSVSQPKPSPPNPKQ